MTEFSAEEEQLFYRLLSSEEAINIENSTKALKEVKQILDDLGITFFLISGTCLGAIRENGLIQWDDDVDIGSVFGHHGCEEASLEEIVTAFRIKGFLTKPMRSGPHAFLPLIKYSAKVSWEGCHIIDGNIEQYPSLNMPANFFIDLKEIDFLDEKYYVPNPPEEYLGLKYGNEWRVPKKHGFYEMDVINQVIDDWTTNQTEQSRELPGNIPDDQVCKIKVLDGAGEPVSGADVIIVGLGNRKTDENGYAEFYLSQDDQYPVIIRNGNSEKVDYFPLLNHGKEYLYNLE